MYANFNFLFCFLHLKNITASNQDKDLALLFNIIIIIIINKETRK